MSLINSIAQSYKGNPEVYFEGKELSVAEKSQELEDALATIVRAISVVDYLTDYKNVDVELLLQIVSSYMVGREQGELDEHTPPPSELFENSLYPSLENVSVEVTKEEIPDGKEDNDSGEGDRATTDVGSEPDSD